MKLVPSAGKHRPASSPVPSAGKHTVGAKRGKTCSRYQARINARKSFGFASNWLKNKHLCSDYLLSNSGMGEKGRLSHANLRKRHTKQLQFLVNNQKQKVILACQKVETVMFRGNCFKNRKTQNVLLYFLRFDVF